MNIRTLLAPAAAFVLLQPGLACAKGAAAKEGGMASYKEYRLKEGFFACQVPADWAAYRDETGDRRQNAYALALTGPKDQGIAAQIIVAYYPPGNKLFPTADAYLARQFAKGPVKIKGETTSAVNAFPLGGSTAKSFTRDTFDYAPPHSMLTREVPVRQERAVLQSEKGLFVLGFSASRESFARHRAAYQKLLDTFRPFPPPQAGN